jgi:hypothetical protein
MLHVTSSATTERPKQPDRNRLRIFYFFACPRQIPARYQVEEGILLLVTSLPLRLAGSNRINSAF